MNRAARAVAPTSVADARHAAVNARDAAADGAFVYSVETTGVYCRPSCAARRARPEHLAFHATPAAAERAGFRPCKRCKPEQPPLAERQAAAVARLCRLIESSAERPTLEELSRHAGWSAFHTHRVFKAITGVTPNAYARANRAKRLRAALGGRGSVTEAIYGAGYGSAGRFYEESNELLGMTATTYRARGVGIEIRYGVGESSLGSLLVAATARGVCAIVLGDSARELVHDLERRFSSACRIAPDPALEGLVAQVVGLVEDPRLSVALPLDIRGTAFQHRVWRALCDIPPGATASYSAVAAAIGAPAAVRAVATACAANAVAVVVPCHRVMRANGDSVGLPLGSRTQARAPRTGGARHWRTRTVNPTAPALTPGGAAPTIPQRPRRRRAALY